MPARVSQSATLSVAIVLGSFFVSSAARAWSSTCSNLQNVPFPLDTNSGSFIQEQELDGWGISNRIDNYSNIWTNNRVQSININFPVFKTESGWDWLKFYDNYNSATLATISGNYSGTVTSGAISFNSLSNWGGTVGFHTDASLESTQVKAISATLTCRTAQTVYFNKPMFQGQRNMGILAATGDDVAFAMPAPASGRSLQLAMWSEVPSVDFDLYARCGAVPTPTSYDAVDSSSNSGGFVSLSCSPGQMVYVVVTSYSGTGLFNLVGSYAYYRTATPLVVTTDFNASAAQLNTFAATTLSGLSYLYGHTEGAFYNPNVVVCNVGKCGVFASSVKVVFMSESGWTWTNPGPTGTVNMYPDDWSNGGQVLAHELGHALFGFYDEYQWGPGGSSPPNCGHSVMAMINSTHFNYCLDSVNHLDDQDPNAIYPIPSYMGVGHAGWTLLYNGTCPGPNPCVAVPQEMFPQDTPDNYSFYGQTFHNNIAVTTYY